MIRSKLQGRNFLISGATGFMGKVLLEKILYSLPDSGKIYVIIRPKKNTSAKERFKLDISDSGCFDRLRDKYKSDFESFICSKIVVVQGDMLKEGLGIAPQDLKEIRENVNIIYNVAASVEFNLPLNQALTINVMGPLQMMELAKSCKNIEMFTQISTSYVNSDKRGYIEDKMYELGFDPEDLVQKVMAMDKQNVKKEQAKILNKFPNTYTFSKRLCEHIMHKRREHLPICIIRPTIVGCSYREPSGGWIDTISAAGAVYLTSCLGIVKELYGNFDAICDQIPVDYSINFMLASTAYQIGRSGWSVYNNGTSSRNPGTWRKMAGYLKESVSKWPWEKAVFKFKKSGIQMYNNKKRYQFIYFYKRELPSRLFQLLAFTLGNHELKTKSHKLMKLVGRAKQWADIFSYFTQNEWIFDISNQNEIIQNYTPEDQVEFDIDVSRIDWQRYIYLYLYGIQHHILKSPVQHPYHHTQTLHLITHNESYFSDIMWAVRHGKSVPLRSVKEMKDMVYNSESVQQVISQLIAERNVAGTPSSDVQLHAQFKKRSEEIMDRMFARMNLKMVKVVAWFLRKVWRRIYEKVVVDHAGLQKIQKLNQAKDGPIIICPTHRSYIDFLIMSFVFFQYQVQLPHIVSGEDFLNIAIVNHILRFSGAFFMRRSFSNDNLYKAILKEYMQRLALDMCTIEFFVEGTRSRTGKMLHPKFGIINWLNQLYFEKKLDNIYYVPVSLNYERVLEGETFPFELLGEEKVKQSLGRLISALKILNMKFGTIYVKIGEPVQMKKFAEQVKVEKGIKNFEQRSARNQFNQVLGYELVHRLTEQLVITPTSMVATVLLTNRKGISDDELISELNWLSKQVAKRGGRIAYTTGALGPNTIQKIGTQHLIEIVDRKRDIFEPSVSLKADYKNYLLLSYYRNALIHLFIQEAVVGCTLSSYDQDTARGRGIALQRLQDRSHFLATMLNHEFVLRLRIGSPKQFEAVLGMMMERGVLEQRGEEKLIKVRGSEGETTVQFLCSLIWPLIDTYWLTLFYIITLLPTKSVAVTKIFQNVQWYAETLYEERIITFYESASQETIKNALLCFEKWGIVEKKTQAERKDGLHYLVTEKYRDEKKLRDLLDDISFFRKKSLIKLTDNDMRTSLLADLRNNMPKL